jgi:hypothetical protein
VSVAHWRIMSVYWLTSLIFYRLATYLSFQIRNIFPPARISMNDIAFRIVATGK